MNFLIGSDVVPTNVNIKHFYKGNVEEIIGRDLLKVWNSVDHRIFNLETPLTDENSPINKQGSNIRVNSEAVKGIKNLKPSLVTIANNHILDQGSQGLNSTMSLLNNNGIPFIGAGLNLKQAAKPFIIKNKNYSVGIYTCAEHEFSIATDSEAGANPFDPLESLDHIYDLKNKCDYVIVLYHGGIEEYRYPSPNLQKICRKIVSKGADLVICQHSHCIGSYEDYTNSKIIYGQGNFLFNKKDNEFWNTGMLIKINVAENFKINFVPIVRTKKGVHLANNSQYHVIMDNFNNRSEKIKDADFVKNKYEEYAEKKFHSYIRNIAGFRKWRSRLDRHVLDNSLADKKYTKYELLKIQNYIECEAHRELFLTGIKKNIR